MAYDMTLRPPLSISFGLLLASTPLLANTLADVQVIVHPSNAISTLRREQLSKLFLKETILWDDNRKVVPIELSKGNSLRSAFAENVHRQNSDALERYWLKHIYSGKKTPPRELASEQDVLDFVRSNPGAIAYISSATPATGVRVVELESATEGSASRESQRQEILAALDRYEAALEAKNLNELKAIWPNLAQLRAKAKAISDSFKFTRQLEVDLEVTDLKISRDAATVTCRRRDEMVLSNGKPLVNETTATFQLRRRVTSWIIESIEG